MSSPVDPSAALAQVFVYGTLKRGGSNHHFLEGQRFLSTASTLTGYALYDLQGYPGMVLAPLDGERITGELWAVTARCLIDLDRLEGTAEGLYQRVPITLAEPVGIAGVETYLYARSVTGRKRIGSSWPVG